MKQNMMNTLLYLNKPQKRFSQLLLFVGLLSVLGYSQADSSNRNDVIKTALGSMQGGYGCLDVTKAGGNVTVFNKCHKGNNQIWTIMNGSAKVTYGGKDYCLSGANKQGTNVKVTSCNSSDPNQKFHAKTNGTIMSGYGFCVDAIPQFASNAHNTVLWACHGGDNQKWSTKYIHTYTAPWTAFVPKYGGFTCKSDINKRRDGCSIPDDLDWTISKGTEMKFEASCALHDICYSSPWELSGSSPSQGQSACDNKFASDLNYTCNKEHNTIGLNIGVCKATADAMVLAVKLKGASSFRGGQQWSEDNCLKNK